MTCFSQEGEITKLELHNSRLFIILVIMGAFLFIGGFNLAYLSKKKIIKNRNKAPSRHKF